LRTSPGERFTVVAEVGAAAAEPARTFLIATQGYYEPWIGRAGLSLARDAGARESADAELLKALRKWGTIREARERAFATQPSPDSATRLRLVSRFPQGLSPDLLARLLAAHGQSALKVVAR